MKKLLRYSSVGLIVFLVQEAFLWAFHQWTQMGPRLGFWAAWLPSVILHFILTKYFAFQKTGGHLGHQVFRYACASAVTTSIQYGFYHLALASVTQQPNLALAIAGLLGTIINYLVMKWGVFDRKSAPGGLAPGAGKPSTT